MYLEQRLIAMLDVLGFSNQIDGRERTVDLLDTYTRMIAHARERILVARSSDDINRNLDFHVFASAEFVFDTLVLVSLPLNPVNVGAFIGATCSLMGYFARNSLPLRGAVGIGDYASDEKGHGTRIAVSSISKALSSAELRQQWSGCYLLLEHESRIQGHLGESDSLDTPTQSSALYRYPVPQKDGNQIDACCLNWLAGLSEQDDCEVLRYMAGDIDKRANTERFVSFYRRLPRTAYPLPSNFLPAVAATILSCGPGVQLHFWDGNGRAATAIGCKHVIFDPKQLPDNAFRGYNTEEEEAALSRSW
jgi:hypothetical protein